MTLLSILAATLAGGLLSVIAAGLLIAGFPQRWLPRLVGFATGVLLAVALLDVLPEAFESGVEAHALFVTLLAGLLGFYGLERIALWRHAHVDEEGHDHHCPNHGHHHHAVGSHTVVSVLIGDGFHNLVDGVLLAAAFLTDPVLGWSTAFAVIAHEVPQEAGDFAILRAAGMSTRRALLWNGVSSLASIAGGLLGYFALSGMEGLLPYILTVAAASFLYIAISDLLPMLRHEPHRHTSIWQTVALLAGIAVIALGSLGHGH
ncbi:MULTISPECIES: ZIP family metal transporter [Uliginosibacterium]|uniref:ZIP family metal transporter n=1 Tax=Uliginosibacterium aquaticum TaxID=2731212 RepID=A0ABX2IMR3_9RHOO|nr:MULTISPECIES: ZIP family metal transporter [Uliginosibacterium]MDO6387274.1 ZIP family metal transporter [Uliginosibacterium sp. 31-12]NSL55959.1 ZIP family metal transporter [Uliginosibacterium aquaticum]PLK50713.1 ZIP family metal transporter [Uliginosibacterium sp. TH139]